MSLRRLQTFFCFLFILASGITLTAGEAGEGVSGRVSFAEPAALLMGFVWLLVNFRDGRASFQMPAEYRVYVPFLVVCLTGVAFSQYPGRGGLELLILVFIFFASLLVFDLYRRLPPEQAVPEVLGLVLWVGGVLAVVGLADFFLWPSLIPNIGNGLVGTFRNAGQAGSFFGVILAILIPALVVGLVRPTLLNLALVSCIGVAIVFTSKRAALLGLAIGLVALAASMLSSASKRDKKVALVILFALLILAPLVYLGFQWGLENIEGMAWRFEKKFSEGSLENFEEDFFADNLRSSLAAFMVSPVVGVGLGNAAGVYTAKYEIHSTYASLLASTGLLGIGAYAAFMFMHARQAFRFRGRDPYGMYLRYYLPMLLGLVVSWGYTYHLRKREFWIMFAVVSLMVHAARRARAWRELPHVGQGR